MRILNIEQSGIIPLSAVYPFDDTVQYAADVEHTLEGYVLKSGDALFNPKDVKGTVFSTAILTEQKSLSSITNIELPVNDDRFITYLQNPRSVKYVTVGSDGWSSFSREQNDKTSIELVFQNGNEVEVSVTQTVGRRYLCKDPSSAWLFFSTSSADRQLFSYFFDKPNRQIMFFLTLSGTHYLVKEVNGTLQISSDLTIDDKCVFNTRQYNTIRAYPDLLHTWVSYTTGVKDSVVDIQPNRCITDVENNYLLLANHYDINVDELPTVFVPLKNQATPEGVYNRGNVYNREPEVQHRHYYNLHLDGNFIAASYTSGVKTVQFPSDKLTYFKFPYVSSPYIVLNVNDSSLTKAGAIGGNVPLNADKVFKKQAPDYTKYTIANEQNGTWLCAWLSASPTPNVPPVWMDRYYNPNFVSLSTALSTTVYRDDFYNMVTSQNKQSELIFDLPSRLVFEPHALYAYHHLGNDDFERLANTRSYLLEASEYTSFRSMDGYDIITELDGDRPVYYFQGDQYASVTASISGSFTVAFQLYADDFSTQFGSQLFGNTDTFKILDTSNYIQVILHTNDGTIAQLNIDKSKVKFGWHHIAVVVNTEEGIFRVFLDGSIEAETTIEAGRYSFYPFLDGGFYSGNSLTDKYKIKDLRVYSGSLDQFDIRNIANIFLKIEDILFNIPSGARNYLDSIERFFRFSIPGRKTTMYNVIIQNSNILDTDVRTELENNLRSIINRVAPAHSKLNTIIWREND